MIRVRKPREYDGNQTAVPRSSFIRMRAGGASVPRDASSEGSAPPKGAEQTQREFIDRLVQPVRRVLARVLRSPADVDDVLQESLLAILDAHPGFRGDSTLLHFAVRISEHRGISRLRSAHRQETHGAMLARLEQPLVAESARPDEEVIRTRRMSVLRKLLHNLPTAQRRVLELRAVLDCSLAEIASTTGVSINTVRTRLRLARRTLSRHIEGDPVLLDLLRG